MQKNNLIKATVVFFIVVILVIATIFYQNNSKTTVITEDAKPPETTTPATAISYKDGTYSADGTYLTPDNEEKIGVTITLKDNLVTSAEVEEKGILATSKNFQEDFIANFKPMVIGKNINEIKLNKISGSSLTPKGFNDAINKIKEQAKA